MVSVWGSTWWRSCEGSRCERTSSLSSQRVAQAGTAADRVDMSGSWHAVAALEDTESDPVAAGTAIGSQTDTGGSQEDTKKSSTSTGGALRTTQDTRGHGITPVRDREAPGSNPGPPTKLSSSDPNMWAH